MAKVMGADVEWPSIEERLAEFDAALTAPPERVGSSHDLEVRRALGLRSGGG